MKARRSREVHQRELARQYRQLSAYERGQALWRCDPRARAHVDELAKRVEDALRRCGIGRRSRGSE